MNRWISIAFPGILAMVQIMTVAAESVGSNLPEINPAKAWRTSAAPAGKAKTFTPVLGENSIRFGNKTVMLAPDGRISCTTPENGLIFNGRIYFHLKENGKTVWLWQNRNLDSSRTRFFRDGNKYVWELWYREKGAEPFKGADQILEVLPDGQLKLSFRFTLPAPTRERNFWAWTFPVTLPEQAWKGSPVSCNGKSGRMTPGMNLRCGASRQEEWVFGAGDPPKSFTIRLSNREIGNANLVHRKENKDFQFRFGNPQGKPAFNQLTLDFRQGVESSSKEIRGGVDFKKQENLVLPDVSHKNLVANPSFECGLDGWHSPFSGFDGHCWDALQREVKPFELDDSVAYDGRHSLRFNIRTTGGSSVWNPNLGPLHLVLEPGSYTLSFYARGESDRPVSLHVWIPNFHRVDQDVREWVFPVSGTQWKRYQAVFKVRANAPLVYVGFFGRDKQNKGSLWIDAVQVEKGGKVTPFEAPPSESRLITSAPDNFLSAQDRIDGRLRIVTAKPGMEGKVRVTVKNFFGEKLLDIQRAFRTDADRTAELPLPLDDLPGLGVFVVRADYALKDGSKAYDFRRYARIEYQSKPRPNRTLFGIDYGNTARNWNFLSILKRWQKLGVGAKHHVGTRRKEIWDLYEQHGVKTYNASMLSYMRSGGGNPMVRNFFIFGSANVPFSVSDVKDKLLLVREF